MRCVVNLEDVKFNIEKIDRYNDGERIKVSIKIPMSFGWLENIKFIVKSSNENMKFDLRHVKNEGNFACFESEIFLSTKAIYHYCFSFEADRNYVLFDKNWKMSINFEVPEWAKGKIMYHIFVDRFKKGRIDFLKEMDNRIIHKSWDEDMIVGPDKNGNWNIDFYGGDLKGIEESLEYIKSLGVSILYLSPIVWSQSNHRYDASDYERIDPYVGSNDDLKRLCDKAHGMGMKIILDAVFNHTGNDSKYFNQYNNFKELGAYQSKNSKYYSFFKKYYNNNNTYFSYWWEMPNLPVCDGNSKEWQNYIYGENGIIDLWFSLGIDGLRLDVADELTDEFIEGIRKAVKRNKEDGFIIGEVWKNPMRMNRGYIESGKGMDSVMNYLLVDSLIRYLKYGYVYKLIDVLEQIKNEYPEDTIKTLMNFTSTHDISRAINIFGTEEFDGYREWVWQPRKEDREKEKNYRLTKEQYEYGKEIYKTYLFTLTFLPGILSIYYGDEVGVEGLGNLANRKTFPWDKVDKDLLMFFKEIAMIRQKEKFLENADMNVIDINNNYFMFERFDDNEASLIAINRSDKNIEVPIPYIYTSPDTIYTLKESKNNEINSHGGLVLKKKRR